MIRRSEKRLLLPLILRLATAAGMILGRTVIEAYKNEIKRIILLNIRHIAARSLRSSLAGQYIKSGFMHMNDNFGVKSPVLETHAIMPLHEGLKILGLASNNLQDIEITQSKLHSDIHEYQKTLHKSIDHGKVVDVFDHYLTYKHDVSKMQRSLSLRAEEINEARKRFNAMMRQNGFLLHETENGASSNLSASKSSVNHAYLKGKLITAYRLLIDPKWSV